MEAGTDMFDEIWFTDRRRIGADMLYTRGTGYYHPFLKRQWFPGSVLEGANNIEKLAGGFVGNENDLRLPRLLGALGYVLYWDNNSETYKLLREDQDWLSIGSGQQVIALTNSEDLPGGPLSHERRYVFDLQQAAWLGWLVNAGGPNLSNSQQAKELLYELNGSGNPYVKKFFNHSFGFPQSDDIVQPPYDIPGLVDSEKIHYDFSTKFAMPSVVEDGTPGYTLNITPNYNYYVPAVEDSFAEVALEEPALPNYYMMYYPKTNDNNELPPVYHNQITLNGNVDWQGNLMGSGQPANATTPEAALNYYGNYNAYLNELRIAGPTAQSDLNTYMKNRYSVICIRPNSIGILNEYNNSEGVPLYNRLPMYTKIQISLNGVDTPANFKPTKNSADDNLFREAMKDADLWDTFITYLIRRDQFDVPPHPHGEDRRSQMPVEPCFVTNDADGNVAKDRRIHGDGFLSRRGPDGQGYDTQSGRRVPTWLGDFTQMFSLGWQYLLDPASPSSWLDYWEDIFNNVDAEYIKKNPATAGQNGVYLMHPTKYVDPDSDGVYEFIDDINNGNNDSTVVYNKLSNLNDALGHVTDGVLKNSARNIDEYLAGDNCYSETFLFKIEKRKLPADKLSIPIEEMHLYPPIQTFYIPNDDNSNLIEYIDTQVFYGQRYQYDIKTIKLVVGSSMKFRNFVYPEEFGCGKALGNALGFYKETTQNLVLPDTQNYVPETEDTPFSSFGRLIGRYVFKAPNLPEAGYHFQNMGSLNNGEIRESRFWVRVQEGFGINDNIDGGTIPVEYYMDWLPSELPAEGPEDDGGFTIPDSQGSQFEVETRLFEGLVGAEGAQFQALDAEEEEEREAPDDELRR